MSLLNIGGGEPEPPPPRSMERVRNLPGEPPAGKATANLNASFSAFDYKPSRTDTHRSFMMDDYGSECRSTRRAATPKELGQGLWGLLQYQQEPDFTPKQGLQYTKFRNGFMRRQGAEIEPDSDRKLFEANREQRLIAPAAHRHERLINQQTFAYNGYNVISADEVPGRHGVPYEWRPGKRRIQDCRHPTGADAPVGRLRDSTSRFHCTPDQLTTSELRRSTLVNDGLTTTKRTSTVIGIGPNRPMEIPSVGVRENFGQRGMPNPRGPDGPRAPAHVQRSEEIAREIAMVRSLK